MEMNVKLGRRFVGIEIDPDSHRIAVARVAVEPVKLFRGKVKRSDG